MLIFFVVNIVGKKFIFVFKFYYNNKKKNLINVYKINNFFDIYIRIWYYNS